MRVIVILLATVLMLGVTVHCEELRKCDLDQLDSYPIYYRPQYVIVVKTAFTILLRQPII